MCHKAKQYANIGWIVSYKHFEGATRDWWQRLQVDRVRVWRKLDQPSPIHYIPPLSTTVQFSLSSPENMMLSQPAEAPISLRPILDYTPKRPDSPDMPSRLP